VAGFRSCAKSVAAPLAERLNSLREAAALIEADSRTVVRCDSISRCGRILERSGALLLGCDQATG
jgi:hypothetical protein